MPRRERFVVREQRVGNGPSPSSGLCSVHHSATSTVAMAPVAWVAPRNERCGITLYARRYASALAPSLTLVDYSPHGSLRGPARGAPLCGLVHVQYESSFFFRYGVDWYPLLCRQWRGIPLVVTLHEVYASEPDVFPRAALEGGGVRGSLRRMLYDVRHPLQRAFAAHCRGSFYANAIVVHHEAHCALLERKGVERSRLHVIELPVPDAPFREFRAVSAGGVHLGAHGFINPHFDYSFLFSFLERIPFPWRFSWIGGVRRPGDESLLVSIRSEIARRGWESRFLVTGWLNEAELEAALNTIDIACAFFSSRSSSSTLAALIARGIPVIGFAAGPCVDIASRWEALVTTEPVVEDAVALLNRFRESETAQSRLHAAMRQYTREQSLSMNAQRTIALYRTLGLR